MGEGSGGGGGGGTLHEEGAERTTIKAVDEERINSNAAVASSNTTILGREAGDGNIDVASDIPLVQQQHKTEAAAVASAAAITAVVMEPAAKLGDGSSQSSHLPELPSSPPYQYTRAQLLYLRPESTTLQQDNTPIWCRKFEQQQPIESSLSMEGSSAGRRNDRFHKYSGNGGQQGGGAQHEHHHIRNSDGKPEEGKRCDRSSMEKHFGKGILEQRQQNRHSVSKENQGNNISGDSSSLLHSTSSATKCSDDFELLLVTENRCCTRYLNPSTIYIYISVYFFPELLLSLALWIE